MSTVDTPAYTTTFGINPHGETISATQRGFTTAFTYDGLGRQTRVDPPVGNATVTTYAPDASWVKVARGPSWTVTSLDGFGRAVGTENSVGVKTQTTYNALGQVTDASAPYTGLQHTGTQFSYDRAGTRRDPHERGQLRGPVHLRRCGRRAADHDHRRGGPPDAADLAGVGEPRRRRGWRGWSMPRATTTTYTYTVLGSLSQVSSPGGVTRTWTYDTQNRLQWQDQPESGRTWYLEYDNVGQLKKQRDANLQDDAVTPTMPTTA